MKSWAGFRFGQADRTSRSRCRYRTFPSRCAQGKPIAQIFLLDGSGKVGYCGFARSHSYYYYFPVVKHARTEMCGLCVRAINGGSVSTGLIECSASPLPRTGREYNTERDDARKNHDAAFFASLRPRFHNSLSSSSRTKYERIPMRVELTSRLAASCLRSDSETPKVFAAFSKVRRVLVILAINDTSSVGESTAMLPQSRTSGGRPPGLRLLSLSRAYAANTIRCFAPTQSRCSLGLRHRCRCIAGSCSAGCRGPMRLRH